MSPLLIALLGVLLVPLFVASWRTSLFSLGLQGLLMAFIAYRIEPHLASVQSWLTLVDLALVRGVVAPMALYSVLHARKAPARNDVIPPNLLYWTIAFGMVLGSFSFAELLVPDSGEQRTLVAVATAGILIGFLVLATQSGPFSQMIGALRFENAIALLELSGKPHEQPLGIRISFLAVFLTTIAFFRWYLATLDTSGSGVQRASSAEGPTL